MPFPVFNNYDETEIQAIVSRLFEVRGYAVRNQHLVDKSREKGADLIASKMGEVEKIAIQVKKKPGSADINQLHDLAERPERIKKYVYIEEPSTDFSKEIESYSNAIDFWDGEKLIREILPNDPYLVLLLLVSDTQTARYLSQIRTFLLACRKETEKEKLGDIDLSKPTKELFHLLWQAKDRACSIGKGLLLMGNIFDQSDRESSALETKDLNYTAHTFVRTIAMLYIQDVEQLAEFFFIMEKRFKEYIEYACIERRLGTEWQYVNNFWFLLPGYIEPTFRLWKKNEKKAEDFLRKYPIDNLRKDITIFDAIRDLSKGIAQLGMGLEGVIDDMWRYALEQFSCEKRKSKMS